METHPKKHVATIHYVVEHYREATCENKECDFFGHPIPLTFTHEWLEDAPLGSTWRDFCKCGDGTGVKLIAKILVAPKEIK